MLRTKQNGIFGGVKIRIGMEPLVDWTRIKEDKKEKSD
jgi:hypothetical protein